MSDNGITLKGTRTVGLDRQRMLSIDHVIKASTRRMWCLLCLFLRRRRSHRSRPLRYPAKFLGPRSFGTLKTCKY